MRNVVYSVAMSLDGHIAGPGGEFDWIPDEPGVDWGAFMARFDTALMGRGTWDVMAAQGTGSLPDMPVYVFSTSMPDVEDERVTVVRQDSEEVVRRLREEEGKEIWLIGGGVLFRSLLDAGLVDEVEVAVIPVLLGSGIRLLPDWSGTARLTLVDSETYPSGIVLLRYDLEGPDGGQSA